MAFPAPTEPAATPAAATVADAAGRGLRLASVDAPPAVEPAPAPAAGSRDDEPEPPAPGGGRPALKRIK
jgi:stringent starvation protein B